ncbi:hypothetical protein WDW86_15745 [Bdellovibrionota bacterium FG-2]
MSDNHTFLLLLKTFALMADGDIEQLGDEEALDVLLRLLERQDPFMLLTKDGPLLFALLRRFGLISPYNGQQRMDTLEPESVCRVLVEFEKWKVSVLKLDQAREFLAQAAIDYQDQSRARPPSLQ